jgi:hypothetical protein
MLNKNHIMPLLGGRLGNNLFMIANAIAKGLEYNKQVVVYRPSVIYHGNDYSKNIFRALQFIDSYENNKNYNLAIPAEDKPTFYSGYYQSETHFEKYSEIIKTLFGPPLEFAERIKKELAFLNNKVVTVINVRRGDYLHSPNYHPVITPEYIIKALTYIPYTDLYLIASDDIEWCKENLDLPNSYFLEGYKPEEQLWILSMCQNFIISNSSFSWWAAYLSRQVEKIVVAPETWFGPEGPTVWQDMYCKDWIVLPTHFDNGLIKPI